MEIAGQNQANEQNERFLHVVTCVTNAVCLVTGTQAVVTSRVYTLRSSVTTSHLSPPGLKEAETRRHAEIQVSTGTGDTHRGTPTSWGSLSASTRSSSRVPASALRLNPALLTGALSPEGTPEPVTQL